MITIISGTNRPNNQTQIIAKYYQHILSKSHDQVVYLSLSELPHDFIFNNEIIGGKAEEMRSIVDKYIKRANSFVIVNPEYNGSFPGILKAFIDSVHPKHFNGKKAALVGVASGRAGNLRGLDQLTNIFNYLKVEVLPLKIPISQIETLLSKDKELIDEYTKNILQEQANQLLSFTNKISY